MHDFKQDTAIIILNYTTIPPVTINASQTSNDSKTEILLENSTTITSEYVDVTTVLVETQNHTNVTNQEIDMTTIVSDKAENQTVVIDNSTMPSDAVGNKTEVTDQQIDSITTVSDLTQNETSTAVDDNNEYSNETTDSLPEKPICDESCQCLRKCPYGFEIVNNICQCDPPCAVSFTKHPRIFLKICLSK